MNNFVIKDAEGRIIGKKRGNKPKVPDDLSVEQEDNLETYDVEFWWFEQD